MAYLATSVSNLFRACSYESNSLPDSASKIVNAGVPQPSFEVAKILEAEQQAEAQFQEWRYHQRMCKEIGGKFFRTESEKDLGQWACIGILPSWKEERISSSLDLKTNFKEDDFKNLSHCLDEKHAYLPSTCMELVTESPDKEWAKKVLQIEDSEDSSEVRRNYKKLALILHPDKLRTDCQVNSLFNCINIALVYWIKLSLRKSQNNKVNYPSMHSSGIGLKEEKPPV